MRDADCRASGHAEVMKRFLIPFLAFVLCPPTQAFGTVSCDGPNSGFISAGSQKVCLRKLPAEVIKAEQEIRDVGRPPFSE